MKLVGDVIGRSVFTSKISTIGVGNWGKTWRREMLLNKNRVSAPSSSYLSTIITSFGCIILSLKHQLEHEESWG